MYRTIPYILAFVAAVLVFNPAKAAVEIGQAAPEIELADTNGNPFKLSDHKGKIVVLEWTNHECPYVRKHYDSGNMQKTQKTVMDMGNVEWITIVSSAKNQQGYVTDEQANEILEKEGAHVTAKLLDVSGEIGKAYGAKTTPHMYIINTDGNIAYMGAIDNEPTTRSEAIEAADNYVLNAITALKEGKEIESKTSQPYGCGVKYGF